MDPKLPASTQHDLKSLLEHVRGQFQYHAGQRLNAIRYYFLAYAIFVTAYVRPFADATSSPSPHTQLALSVMALIVTLGFWALDARNVQMVHIDENALKEIEKLVSFEYHFKDFEMAKKWDEAPYGILRYQVIVNGLFAIISLITLVAVIRDARLLCML